MLPTYSNGLFFVGPPFRHGDLYDDKATAYIENGVMSFYKLSLFALLPNWRHVFMK